MQKTQHSHFIADDQTRTKNKVLQPIFTEKTEENKEKERKQSAKTYHLSTTIISIKIFTYTTNKISQNIPIAATYEKEKKSKTHIKYHQINQNSNK